MSETLDDEIMYSEDDSGSEYSSELEDADESCFDSPTVPQAEVSFQVLDSSMCNSMAQKRVDEITELLSCSEEAAVKMLRLFKWDREKLMDAWATEPEVTCRKAGLEEGDDRSIVHSGDGTTVFVGGVSILLSSMQPEQCQICFDSSTEYSAAACGHAYCSSCYSKYLRHKVEDEGHECINARCPFTKCHVTVSKSLAYSLLPPGKFRTKYEQAANIGRSFVDDNQSIKWCPGKDCGYALRAWGGKNSVICECKHRFCFRCLQDDHQPCSCDQLKQWTIKCKDDSETYNWLVANTKACPKCSTSIEKNGGCNHMTCKNGACKYEFCWVCMGPWKEHAGSYYACNKFDPEKEKESESGQKKEK